MKDKTYKEMLEDYEASLFAKGIVSICPVCLYSVITASELEDNGKCVECWHRSHIPLTQ